MQPGANLGLYRLDASRRKHLHQGAALRQCSLQLALALVIAWRVRLRIVLQPGGRRQHAGRVHGCRGRHACRDLCRPTLRPCLDTPRRLHLRRRRESGGLAHCRRARYVQLAARGRQSPCRFNTNNNPRDYFVLPNPTIEFSAPDPSSARVALQSRIPLSPINAKGAPDAYTQGRLRAAGSAPSGALSAGRRLVVPATDASCSGEYGD